MIIAIDTGGTKTLIASFDTDGVMQQIAKFATPRDTSDYALAVSQAIFDAVTPADIDAVVAAVPGPVVQGRVKRVKNIHQSWDNLDYLGLLRQSLPGVTRVYVANDADLAGIAESRALDPVPRTSLYVTLSTGIGTGIAIDGHLPSSVSMIEGGWMRLSHEGKPQIWEDFASGRNFYERYQQYGADVDDPDKWRDYADRVTVGLLAFIPIFTPDHIVIGGSMGTHFAKYEAFLKSNLQQHLSDFDPATMTQAKHPEEAVIYGCYYHAIDQLAN